jgi:hypothetical protein
MKRFLFILFLMVVILGIAGCGGNGGGSNDYATINCTIDIAKLYAGVSLTPTIREVTILITRQGYQDYNDTLGLSSDKKAATITLYTQVTGDWNFKISVYTYENWNTPLYTGNAVINIPSSNAIVNCTNDNFQWTTGYDPEPMSGYTSLNQTVNSVLSDPVHNTVYIFDANQSIIGVYNADTLALIRNISLSETPSAVAFNYDKSAILLGYPSGLVFSCNLSSGNLTQINSTSAGSKVSSIVPLKPDLILVHVTGYTKILNTANGSIVDSFIGSNPTGNYHGCVFNEALSTVYTCSVDISPADLYRIRLDFTSGATYGKKKEFKESIYHGDYGMYAPLCLIDGGNKLTTSSGNIFTVSMDDSSDLIHSGSLPYSYRDLAYDSAAGALYLLYYHFSSNSVKKLFVLAENTYSEQASVNIKGTPLFVTYSTNSIIVFSQYTSYDGVDHYYGKVFSKTNVSANMKSAVLQQGFSKVKP